MSVSSRRPGNQTPADFAAAVQDLLPIIRMGGRESHADSIRAQREVGEIVLKFVPEKPKHGEAVYAVLGKTIGYRGEWVFRAKCFALRYTKKEMKALLRIAPHISFAHVIQLLSVPNDGARVEFEAKLGKNRWTVAQLKHAIQEEFGLRRTNSGPKPKLPASPQDALQQMFDAVIALNKRWREWGKKCVLSKRATKFKAVKTVLKKLEDEVAQYSQAVHSAAAAKSKRKVFT